MDLTSFEVNQESAQEGVWCDLADGRVLIARYGNKKFTRFIQRAMAPYKQMAQRGNLPEKVNEKIMIEALAKHVLLGWENLTINKEPLEYSHEKAQEILADERFKDFREIILAMSQEAELFRDDEVEDAVGKLEATSVGNLSGVDKKAS